MTDYNSLDDATKERLRKQINDCAQSLGGKNYFLQQRIILILEQK